MTSTTLRKQRNSPSMSAATFKRLHLNAWVAPDVDRWIDSRKWDELADGDEIAGGSTVFVGADGSRSYDTTCVAWAHKATDGRIDVDARVFSVRDDVPHHVLHGGGTIDFGDVEAFLLELASRFTIAEVRYDPRFLQSIMDALAGRWHAAVAPVEPYSGGHRLALQVFERQVLDGTLRHRGDPAIGAQVAATAVDRFDNGDPRRLRKLDRTRPIDASVALALAVHAASLDAGQSIYETRGVLSRLSTAQRSRA